MDHLSNQMAPELLLWIVVVPSTRAQLPVAHSDRRPASDTVVVVKWLVQAVHQPSETSSAVFHGDAPPRSKSARAPSRSAILAGVWQSGCCKLNARLPTGPQTTDAAVRKIAAIFHRAAPLQWTQPATHAASELQLA